MSDSRRWLHYGDSGPDVVAVKRAVKQAGLGTLLVLRSPKFGHALDRVIRQLQRKHGLNPDGVVGPATYKVLKFDDYGKQLLAKAPKTTPQEETYARLVAYMEKMTRETSGYLWGAGHGVPLSEIRIDRPLDCSSSVSKALWTVGLFPHPVAWVSGEYEYFGQPGDGKLFTIEANGEHVWLRLHRGKYWRFDTSPHGDGGRGPRLRRLPRFTRGFVPRHASGY